MNHAHTLRTRLTEARRTYAAAAQDARGLTDPDLTHDALAMRRHKALQEAREAYGRTVRAIRTEHHHAAARNRKALDVFPTAAGSTRDAWDRVAMRLDAGASLGQIVTTADVPTLQAIREWGPSYLTAHSADPSAEPDTAALERATLRRYAIVTEDAGLLAALEEGPALAGLALSLEDAEAEALGAPGAGSLNGAIAAAFAEQHAASEGLTTMDA